MMCTLMAQSWKKSANVAGAEIRVWALDWFTEFWIMISRLGQMLA